MPGYSEADLIQARKPIKDQAGRDLAFCTLGHLEAEQREAATSDRAEAIRALRVNIATFDGVEPEAEADELTTSSNSTGVSAATSSMHRTLAQMGLQPTSEA